MTVLAHALTSARLMLGTLQAQGYPVAWLEAQAGIPLAHLLGGAHATAREIDTLRALGRMLGEAMATPRVGLSQADIDATATAAFRAGFLPPAAYDDDGTPHPQAVPGHPWQEDDDRCARRLHVLALLTRGHSPARAADEAGVHRATVRRVVTAVNLQVARMGADAWRAARDAALAAWEEGHMDATTTAVRLGVMPPRALTPDNPARHCN